MLRTIIYLLVGIFLITLLRAVIGLITRAVAELFRSEYPARANSSGGRSSQAGFGGELVKDPVCGTFVSPASSVQKKVGGQTYHFCSEACREKFSG